MIFSSTVPNGTAPIALLDYLTKRFTYHTKEKWRIYIAEGRIFVNEQKASSELIIQRGDRISYQPYPFEEPDVNCDFSIVYEDKWIAGVNKPANLPVHRCGRYITRNLIYLLRQRTDSPSFTQAGLAHRLDRETSGVVVVVKEIVARGPLQRIFASGEVDKEYIAIVNGIPNEPTMTIDAPIGRDRQSNAPNRFMVDEKHGKPSKTRIEVIKQIGQKFAVLRIRPQTGRTHQIRVHLAWIGTPCLGDLLYGKGATEGYKRQIPASAGPPAEPDISRLALHCRSVSFFHPFTQSCCVIKAPLPAEMAAFLGEEGKEWCELLKL